MSDVTLEIDADARKAEAEIRRFSERVSTSNGPIGKLKGGLSGLQNALGGAATATSGLSGAMGGLGSGAAQATGALDNLANAATRGGVLSLAIVGLVGLVGVLVDKFRKAKEEARALALETVEGAEKSALAFRQDLQKAIEQATDDPKKGVGAFRTAVQNVNAELEMVQERIKFTAQVASSAKFRIGAGITTNPTTGQLYSVELAEANKELTEQKARYEALQGSVFDISEAEDAINAAIAKGVRQRKLAADEAAKLRKLTKAIKQETQGEDPFASQLLVAFKNARAQAQQLEEDEARRRSEALANSFEDLDEHKAIDQERLDFYQGIEDERIRIANEAAERIAQKNEDEAARAQAAWTNMAFGVGEAFTHTFAGTAQDALDALIRGEQDALGEITAQFMQSIGTQLVGIGIRSTFQGLSIAATGNLAAAAPSLAVGAGAIAAGVGLGATGSAVSHASAGGSLFQALPDSGSGVAQESGFRSAPRAEDASSSGVVVNISYGAAGPDPDAAAQHIGEIMERYHDRFGGPR